MDFCNVGPVLELSILIRYLRAQSPEVQDVLPSTEDLMHRFARVMMPITVALLILGTATVSMAGIDPVPEIDPSSGMSAIALIAAAVIVIRGRRKN